MGSGKAGWKPAPHPRRAAFCCDPYDAFGSREATGRRATVALFAVGIVAGLAVSVFLIVIQFVCPGPEAVVVGFGVWLAICGAAYGPAVTGEKSATELVSVRIVWWYSLHHHEDGP